jgi:spermidine/putrescine-binding protein
VSTTRSFIRSTPLFLAFLVVAAACSSNPSTTAPADTGASAAAPTGTVSLFGYEDVVLPSVVQVFEKAYPGVTVNTATMATNDEAVTKLQAGFQADVIHICTDDTPRMVKLGLLQPIDPSRLPEWSNQFPTFRDLPGMHIDGKLYMVPIAGGYSGIVYNPQAVAQPITSYRQLFEDPALEGKVTLEDSAQSTIAIAALGLGYKNPWTMSNADVAKVGDYIVQHIANVRTFFDGDAQFLSLYKSGEIVAGFGYHDYPVSLKNAGQPVAFSSGEGSIAWVCGFGISSHAKNIDAAYALLNWYLTPKIQEFYTKQYTYLWTNQEVTPAIDPELVKTLGMDDPAKTLGGLIPLELPANYDEWLSQWSRIRSS